MITKTTLKNGVRVLTIPHQDTKAVTVLVLVATGSKYETKEQNGISHFLEHMFFKGTKKRPTPVEVVETIDEVGGAFNAFTSTEYTGYFVKVEYEHVNVALDLVSDIFFNSLFPSKEIQKEKGVVIEEINIYKDNPMRRIEDLWQKMLYGDQPAGWNIAGSPETVSSLTRKGLLAYMQSQYVSLNTVVCVAGRIDEQRTIKSVGKLFGNMKTSAFKDKSRVRDTQEKPNVLVEEKKTDQTRIALGVKGYDLSHPARYAQDVLATLLGGMMSSRLFLEVREKLGIAYDIRTSSENDTDTGHLVTMAGVPHAKTEIAIRAIMKEYKKIAKVKVSDKELKKAKDHMKGSMELGLESSEAKASFFGMQELLEKKFLTPSQVHATIAKVRAEDVRRVAQELFLPHKMNLAILGPSKDSVHLERLIS
ncbi:MAG: insulinase family protein [Candidatus Wildermuthbacteria bacterium]|nr:insulinase family protein [Candidatus Wildermuthbacteria bacterium]